MTLQEKLIFILVLFYSTIILIIDSITPLGFSVPILYISLIAATCFLFTSTNKLYFTSLLCVLFTLLGFYISPEGGITIPGITNRALAIIIIFIITILGKNFIDKKNIEQLQYEELDNLNNELTQFAYRTSHDLKSPLITIRRLAEYIKKDIHSDEKNEALSNTNQIINQSKKLEALVSDILKLTKAELQESDKKRCLSLTKMIDGIIEKHIDLIEQKKVNVIYSSVDDNQLCSESIRISQILENLITNGIKYSDPNENEPFVKITTHLKDEKFLITVQDNGLGIPEKERKNIFNMFSRFHPEIESGSGMGLYIVKKHIEKLDGDIAVFQENKITKFEIILPNQLV